MILFCTLFVVLTAPEMLLADPPIFPGDPDQVPVDGGLSLLAAAGGAYALNKLRKRKQEAA
ncbi:MAG: PID-CTERM protein-sorting domain-containing protein [Cyclonatronaceae bacterium]